MAMIAVHVEGVGLDSNHGPVVVLRETDGNRILPIWIGHNEAAAIQMKLDGQDYIRPLTHDLMQSIIQSLNAQLTRVEITELKDSTYFAKLTLLLPDGTEVTVDARPSDSVALALRADAQLLVHESLFRPPEADGLEPPGESDDEKIHESSEEEIEEQKREALRKRLRNIDPGEFGSFRLGG